MGRLYFLFVKRLFMPFLCGDFSLIDLYEHFIDQDEYNFFSYL